MYQKLHLGTALVAIALPLVCIQLAAEAQKTAQRWSPASSNPQSVYGGYQQTSSAASSSFEQPRQPVAPVQQRGRSPSRQTSRAQPARPEYQQQQQQQEEDEEQQQQQPQQQPRPQPQPLQQQQQQDAYESQSSDADSAEADAEPAQYGK